MSVTSLEPARPLSFDEILAARRPLQRGEEIEATDCLSLAPFPDTNNTLWISSPNMDFVPEPPVHKEGSMFSYFSDGMLGAFEHMKWPQAYYDAEPHSIAVPGNPQLLNFNLTDTHGLGPAFPRGDHNTLPGFVDSDIPWYSFTSREFLVCQDLPSEAVGTLSPAVLARLRFAMEDIKGIVESIAVEQISLAKGSLDRHFEGTVWANYRYQSSRSERLYRTYHNLTQVPMSTFDTVLWFREFQRILLELRGWAIYMKVVQPRWNDSVFEAKDVLPVRGVITSNISLVEKMFKIGIPVWYIRKAYTITNRTFIARVKTVISPALTFSFSRIMKHGHHWSDAPLWIDASHEDRSNIQERVRRFCLSSRPCLRPLEAYDAAAVAAVATLEGTRSSEQVSHGVEPTGSSNNDAELRQCTEDTDVQQVEIMATYTEKNYGFDIKLAEEQDIMPTGPIDDISDYNHTEQASLPMSSSSIFQTPTQPSSSAQVPVRRTSSFRTNRANQVVKQPAWLPPLASGWSPVLAGMHDFGDELGKALLYPLPPCHLFFSDTSQMMVQKVHNWLRIRIWCIAQVLNPPENQMVLMTTSDWRVALEGRYYAVIYDPTHVHPKSSTVDISRLPDGAPELKRPRLAASPSKRKRDTAADKRLARRVDIQVRFGVHAGFEPYESTMTAHWGNHVVTSDEVDKNTTLWAEVVWELSVLNFRLELIDLDRELMSLIYHYRDQSLAAEREANIHQIWHGGPIRPMWHEGASHCDPLGLDDWEERQRAVKAMANVVRDWPRGFGLVWIDSYHTSRDGYLLFECKVFRFYATTFHAHRGRLPTMPMSLPSSLSSRV